MEITFGSWRLAIEQVTPSVSELSQQYNTAAPNWHQSIEQMGFIEAYRSIFAQMQATGRICRVANQLSVLDVGIGTGGLAQGLLAEENRPIHLTGVDISAQMLAETESNFAGRLDSLELLQQDMQWLQLQDNQFDLVMGAHVLEHLSDMRQGLSEMIRVARPGAPILLVVTRRGLASSWLHLIWQIKTVRAGEMQTMFGQMGLENIELLWFRWPVWCNWMSVAIVGSKPQTQAETLLG